MQIRSSASGTLGLTVFGDGTGLLMTLCMIVTSAMPFQILLREATSQSMTPTAKMSVRRSSALPRICSGGMNRIFPLITPARVSWLAP
jgi:hypothetical protein